MSDEGLRGAIGGWLKGFRRRRGRYGAAEGQRGIKSASPRAVGQAGEQFAVAGWGAYDEVAGGLIITIQCEDKIKTRNWFATCSGVSL